MKVRWYSDTKSALQQYNCHYESTKGEEAEIIVYIDDTISQVLILPNNRPSTFRMSKIELLLPARVRSAHLNAGHHGVDCCHVVIGSSIILPGPSQRQSGLGMVCMDHNDGVAHYTERMVPDEAHARVFWEHVGRYRFAKNFVSGKRVLDIACGEGYGAAALAKAGAASVIGVDISSDTCQHAQRKYGLDARTGDAQAIPLPDRSIDRDRFVRDDRTC